MLKTTLIVQLCMTVMTYGTAICLIFMIFGYYPLLGCFDECCQDKLFDCRGYYNIGHTTSGVYEVTPRNMQTQYKVYCDMTTDGGGWLVFQRRVDGSIDFNRGWDDYERGFGNITHEHWLGLAVLTRLLHKEYEYELRVELEDWEGNSTYAKYNRFWIGDYTENYKLTAMLYDGTAGDSLKYHSGLQFTTFDNDNDLHSANCANITTGGWWFKHCKQVNLNARYYTTNPINTDDLIHWYHWRGATYSLKHTEMKIRRL